jgi:SAM-dependent methyltransferase
MKRVLLLMVVALTLSIGSALCLLESGEKDISLEAAKNTRAPDVKFAPTPQDVVDYDLGCGDGRIVVTAAKRYGCRAVGYDVDPQRIEESLANVEKNNVDALVGIKQEDIFQLDLSKADVVTLYLLPSMNVKLIPQLKKLKPGSRIVSHDFSIKGVQPDKFVKVVSEEDGREHFIYLWKTPLNKLPKKDEGLGGRENRDHEERPSELMSRTGLAFRGSTTAWSAFGPGVVGNCRRHLWHIGG